MKRCLSVLLLIAMLLSMWPTQVFAEEPHRETSEDSALRAEESSADNGIPMVVEPSGNIIMNSRSGGWNKGYRTYFVVKMTPAENQDELITGLREGSLHLWVTVYDHTTGEEYPEFRYFSNDPAFDYNLSGVVNISATGNCPKLEADHAYSLCIVVKDQEGNRRYYGNSELEAFANSTDSGFTANGGIEAYYGDYTVDTDSPLYGKSVLFIGDSITEASFENAVPGLADIAGWPGRVGYTNGMEWINAGVSGATLAYGIAGQMEDYAAMNRKFDYIVIHGGVNDAGFNCSVGSVSSYSVDSLLADTNLNHTPYGSYASGLERAIVYAKQNFPEAKLLYIMNYKLKSSNDAYNKFTNGNYANLPNYFAVGKKVCEKWDVAYVDLYNTEKLSAQMQYETRHTIGDELHPNNIGYDMIAPYVSSALKSVATGEAVRTTPYNFVNESAEIRDTDVNLALGKPVVNGKGESIPNATNGKLDNSKIGETIENLGNFTATGKPYGTPDPSCYAQVDLEETYVIEKVNVNLFHHDRANSTFKWEVYTSLDGENWVNVGGKRNFQEDNYYGYAIAFEPVAARYVRVNITFATNEGGYLIAQLNELEVYGVSHTHTEKVIPGKAATCSSVGRTDEVVCAVCGQVLTPAQELAIDPENHSHVVNIPAVKATCGQPGKSAGSRCTDCGEYIVEPKEDPDQPATGEHTWENIPGVAATCTAKGYEAGRRCTVCGETERKEIPALGHNEDLTIPAVEATCSKPGLTQGTRCSRCGAVQTAQKETAVNPENHSGIVTVTAIQATCSATGLAAGKICADCGKVIQGREVLEKDPEAHRAVSVPAVAPTCTQSGLTEGQKCALCGKVLKEQQTVAATGHTPIAMPAVEATCTATGLTEGQKCFTCGEVLEAQTETPKIAHTPVAIADKAATCVEEGQKGGTKCSVCGEIVEQPQVVEKLPHVEEVIPAQEATCASPAMTEGRRCVVCGTVTVEPQSVGEKDTSKHNYVADITLTTKGTVSPGGNYQQNGCKHVLKCTICGDQKQAEDCKYLHLGTNPINIMLNTPYCSTCGLVWAPYAFNDPFTNGLTQEQYKEKEASGCAHKITFKNSLGEQLIGDQMFPIGTDLTVLIEGTPATETTAGTTSARFCRACLTYVDGEPKEIAPHTHTLTYVDNGDGTHSGKCTFENCEYTLENVPHVSTDEAHPHSGICASCNAAFSNGQHVWAIAPYSVGASDTVGTHTHKLVCSVCGEAKTETATLTEENPECQCGAKYMADPSACTHSETVLVTGTPATCTTAGHTSETVCRTCFKVITPGEEIPATGHTYVCSELDNGAHATLCTACGQVLDGASELAKLIHVEEVIPATEATCASPAMTEGRRCVICGEITVVPQPVGQKDTSKHNYVVVPGSSTGTLNINRDPSSTATYGGGIGTKNYSHRVKCTICGDIETEDCKFADGNARYDIFDCWPDCEVCGSVISIKAFKNPLPETYRNLTGSQIAEYEAGGCAHKVTLRNVIFGGYDTTHNLQIDTDLTYTVKGITATETTPGTTDARFCRACKTWVDGEPQEVAAHTHTLKYTDNGDGTHNVSCTFEGCNYAEENVPHVSADAENPHSGVCASCGAEFTNQHVWHIAPYSLGEGEEAGAHTHKLVCDSCGAAKWESATLTEENPECQCGAKYMADPETCTHTEKLLITGTPATCTTAGHTSQYACRTCYKTLTTGKEILASGHSYVYKDLGETHAMVCSVCGAQEADTAAAHSLSEYRPTSDGKHMGYCVCGKAMGEEEDHTTKVVEIGAETHTLVCPKCSQTVVYAHDFRKIYVDETHHYRQCDQCGLKILEIHDQAASADATDPSHYHVITCPDCGTEEVKQAHSFEEYTTSETKHAGTCAVCGYELSENHSFGPWQYDGTQHWRVCTVCDYEETRTDHVWTADKTAETDKTHTLTCVCGAKKVGNHDLTLHATAAEHSYTCDCGYATEAEAHNFASDWADNGNGKTHGKTCLTCGYVHSENHSAAYQYDEVQHWFECAQCRYYQTPVAHTWVLDKEQSNKDCHVYVCECGATKTEQHNTKAVESKDNPELHEYICQDCGFVVTSGAHDFTDYTPVDDNNHSRICRVCGVVRTEAHQLIGTFDDTQHKMSCQLCGMQTSVENHNWTTDEASSDDTQHTLVCSCGATKSEAHTEGWELSKDGIGETHRKICRVCGRQLSQPEAHSFVLLDNGNGKTHMVKCEICKQRYMQEHTATYTMIDGNSEKHLMDCSDCGAHYRIAHEFTYEDVDENSHIRTCSLCGLSETTAHDEIASSFDENGHISFCQTCGRQNISRQHTMEVQSTNPAQHTMKCSGCPYTVKADHTYVNEVCSVCDYYEKQIVDISGSEVETDMDFISYRDRLESLNGVLIDGDLTTMNTIQGKITTVLVKSTTADEIMEFDRIYMKTYTCPPPSYDIYISNDLENWTWVSGKKSGDPDLSVPVGEGGYKDYELNIDLPCTAKYVLFQLNCGRPGYGDKYWPLSALEFYKGDTKLSTNLQFPYQHGMPWLFPVEGPGVRLKSVTKIQNVVVYSDSPECNFRLVSTATMDGGKCLNNYVDYGTYKGSMKVQDGVYMHVFEGSANARFIVAMPTIDMLEKGFAKSISEEGMDKVQFHISEIKVYAGNAETPEEPVSVTVNGEANGTLTDGDKNRYLVTIDESAGGAIFEYATSLKNGRFEIYAPNDSTTFRILTSEDGENWTAVGDVTESVPYFNVFRYTITARYAGKFFKIIPAEDTDTVGAYEVEMYRKRLLEPGEEITTPETPMISGVNGALLTSLTNDSHGIQILPLGENCYIDVDFGEEYEVGKVVVYTYHDHYSFKIEGTTDGKNWTLLGSNEDRPAGYDYDKGYTVYVEPGYYSKLRITALTGAYESFSLFNIDVFAPEAASEEKDPVPTISMPVRIHNYLADGMMFEWANSNPNGLGTQRKTVLEPISPYQAPYFLGVGGVVGTNVDMEKKTDNPWIRSQLMLNLNEGDASVKVINKTAKSEYARYVSMMYHVEMNDLAGISFSLFNGETSLIDGLSMVDGKLVQDGNTYFVGEAVRNGALTLEENADEAHAFQVKANEDGTYSFALIRKEQYTDETLFLTKTEEGWSAAVWADDASQKFSLKNTSGSLMEFPQDTSLTVAASNGAKATVNLETAPGWHTVVIPLEQTEEFIDWLSVSAPAKENTLVSIAYVAGFATQEEAQDYNDTAKCYIWQIFENEGYVPQTDWTNIDSGFGRAVAQYPELCQGELFRVRNIGNNIGFSMTTPNVRSSEYDDDFTLFTVPFGYVVQSDEEIEDNSVWRSYLIYPANAEMFFKEITDGSFSYYQTGEYTKGNTPSHEGNMNFYLDKLHSELISGYTTIGLTEYELNQETESPLYTMDTVQKMAKAMKDALEIPEYSEESRNGLSIDGYAFGTDENFRFFNDSFVVGQKDGKLYGYNGTVARDLGQWVREHIAATQDTTVATTDWAAYTADASKRLLDKSWTEVAGPDPSDTSYAIRNYLDFAYWFMNNLYNESGISQDVSEFTNIVFTQQATVDADGNPTTIYVFNGNNDQVEYDVKNGEISNDTPDTISMGKPFLPTLYSGAVNPQSGGANPDYGYTMDGHGKFVFDSQANQYFYFSGDDDVYLFINNKLVLDLGGAHSKSVARFNLNDYIEECGLKDGEEYDFDFFYMERHSTAANIRIETNINIVPKEISSKKGAFEDGKEVPNYGGISGTKELEYYFEITNNYDPDADNAINLKDLTFQDDDLNVIMTKDQIKLSTYGDGIARNVADLTVTVTDAAGQTVYEAKNLTEEQLKTILETVPVDPENPGLQPGQTFRISGVKYLLTEEQLKDMTFKNQVFTSASGIKGTATHTVTVEGTKQFFIWKGHDLNVPHEVVFDQMSATLKELITEDGYQIRLKNTGSQSASIQFVERSGDTETIVDSLDIPGTGEEQAAESPKGYVRFTYDGTGSYNAKFEVVPKNSALVNPFSYTVTLMVFDVEKNVYVLDYGLPVKLNEGNAALTANDTLTAGSIQTAYELTGMMDGDGTYNSYTGTVDGTLVQDQLTPKNGYGYYALKDNGLTFVSTAIMDNITKAQVVLRLSRNDGVFTKGDTLDVHNQVEMVQDVVVVPASVVYYDDNHGGLNYNDNTGKIDDNAYQSPDQDTPYGSDPWYAGQSGENSGGLVHTFTCNEQKVLANFTFQGTGFEIISRAVGKDPALINVTVKNNDENGDVVYRASVYTEYKNSDAGENAEKGVVYQIPAIRKDFGKAGKYYVEIKAIPTTDKSGAYTYAVVDGSLIFIQKATDTTPERRWRQEVVPGTKADYQYVPLKLDENNEWVTDPDGTILTKAPNIIETSIYIDGIRIYNPLSAADAEQYYSDTEKYASFLELRKLMQQGLLGAAAYGPNAEGQEELVLGMDAGIFVENRNGKFSGSVGTDVNAYLKSGSNNEVYIDGTEGSRAIVFYVKADEAMEQRYRTLQIASRLLNKTGLGLDDKETANPAGDPATLRISTYDAVNGFGWDEHEITSGTEQYYTIDMTKCYYHPGEDGIPGTEDDFGYQVVIMVSGGVLSFTSLKVSGYTLQNVGNVWGNPEDFLKYSGGVSSEVLPDLEDQEKAEEMKVRTRSAMAGIRGAMGLETPVQPVEELGISSVSLTLKSDISMNFYVREEALKDWENPYMTFTKALYDEDGNVTDYVTETATDYTVKNGCRVYTFNGISAMEMSSQVKATLFATKNGVLSSGGTVEYSVVTYVRNTLKNSHSADLNTLLVDLVNYGTEAQRYWNYNMTELANSCLTEEQQAMGTQDDPVLTNDRVLTKNSEGTVSFQGVSLSLKEKVTLNFYMRIQGEAKNLEMLISYKDNEGLIQTASVDGSQFEKRGNSYVASFHELNPAQMRTVLSVQVVDKTSGVCVSDTMQYSIVSYAYSKARDTQLSQLVKAMMKYGDSTANYFFH